MKKGLLFVLIGLCFFLPEAGACTSIIISGKATPDGRPLMWKHRDTGAPYNHMVYVDEGGYRFLGLVNSYQPEGAVWTGSNETGFSIMNTASYNLKDDDVKEMDHEGLLMPYGRRFRALSRYPCASAPGRGQFRRHRCFGGSRLF